MKLALVMLAFLIASQAFAAADITCKGKSEDGADVVATVQLSDEASLKIERNGKLIIDSSGEDVSIDLEAVPRADGTVVQAQVISAQLGHGEFGMLMVEQGKNKATVFVAQDEMSFYGDLLCE